MHRSLGCRLFMTISIRIHVVVRVRVGNRFIKNFYIIVTHLGWWLCAYFFFLLSLYGCYIFTLIAPKTIVIVRVFTFVMVIILPAFISTSLRLLFCLFFDTLFCFVCLSFFNCIDNVCLIWKCIGWFAWNKQYSKICFLFYFPIIFVWIFNEYSKMFRSNCNFFLLLLWL